VLETGLAGLAAERIPLGLFSDVVEDDELVATVARVVQSRVFDAANVDGSGS
jgi:hypothetical protein